MAAISRKRVRPWLAGLVLVCLGLSGCTDTEGYKNMRFDANSLDKLTEVFFYEIVGDEECVTRLDNMIWQRSGGKFGSQITTVFEYDRDGINYSFYHVDKTDKFDPYHLTVSVHTVRSKGYRYLYGASLQNNRFGEGIGAPTMGEKWKSLLDDQVREDLERVVPESEQDKWNRKVLEEYTGILKCFFDEQHGGQ